MKTALRETSALVLTFVLILAAAPLEAKSREQEAAGALLFRDKGCSYCHGTNLTGTQKGPSLGKVRKSLKEAQVSEQIRNGGQKMPPFGDSLSNVEINQLVQFLRAKHRPAVPPATQNAPAASPLSNPVQ